MMFAFILSGSYTRLLLLPQSSLSPEGWNLVEMSCLGLSVPRFSLYAQCLSVGLCICSHLLQEEASLMMDEQCTHL